MRLSDYKNEAAIELFADMMEPAGKILSDDEVKEAFSAQPVDKAGIIQLLMKKHSSEVVDILRLIDGGDPKTYTISFLEIPLKLMELINDPEVLMLFMPQGQNAGSDASGSAMDSIEEGGK